MLFTIFNTAMLDSGMGEFKWQTEDEEMDQLDREIEYYKGKGFLHG